MISVLRLSLKAKVVRTRASPQTATPKQDFNSSFPVPEYTTHGLGFDNGLKNSFSEIGPEREVKISPVSQLTLTTLPLSSITSLGVTSRGIVTSLAVEFTNSPAIVSSILSFRQCT